MDSSLSLADELGDGVRRVQSVLAQATANRQALQGYVAPLAGARCAVLVLHLDVRVVSEFNHQHHVRVRHHVRVCQQSQSSC